MSLTLNPTNGKFDVVVKDHTKLKNIGTNTHTQIDTHIADTTNPHDTSDANLVTTDVTTNNATTLKHGFLPKLSGSATQYLTGQGTYATISGSSTPPGYTAVSFSGQTSVNVVHNFGIKPLVQVLDSSGSPLVLIPLTISHATDNDFTVTFDESTTGTIIASAGSPSIPNVVTTAISYTVLVNDNIVQASAQNITITLPTAIGYTGKTYTIDNESGGNIFITGTSGQTIQGEVINIIPPNSSVTLYSTGAVWRAT